MSTLGIIDELCKEHDEREKFSRLTPYFDQLNVSDLSCIDDFEDLIRDIPHCDRILMRVFISKYLQPMRKKSIDNAREIKQFRMDDGIYVEASSLLVGSYLADIDENNMTVQMFHNWLIGNGISELRLIDMSRNNLSSSDMISISIMVEDLQKRGLISADGLIIDLSNNRIHGIWEYQKEVDDAIKRICSSSSVEFLDLKSNPFVDRKDYFHKNSSFETRKLIWVHNIQLSTYGWRTLLPDHMVENVGRNHAKYYAWRKEKNLLC